MCKIFVNRMKENQNVNITNNSYENVAKLKCLGMILRYQNCIQDESKSRVNSVNACYHSLH
jgi:hypothetical protein